MKTNKFDQLSPEDQHHIIDLCNRNTYPKAVELLAKPRPEGLALNTSVSALCRFFTTWNPINQQAKLMEQLGKSLRVCRQATPVASLTGVLAILENNLLKQLSDGKPAEDLEKQINLMTRVHRAFITEESLNHKRGHFNSRADYFKHIQYISGEHDFDFARNDLPEKPVGYPSPDTYSPEDEDIEDLAAFTHNQVPKFHVPLNAENYKHYIEHRRPLPHIQMLEAAKAIREQNSKSAALAPAPGADEIDSPEPARASFTPSQPRSADSLVRSNQTQPNPVTEILDSLCAPGNSGKIPSKTPVIPQIPLFLPQPDFDISKLKFPPGQPFGKPATSTHLSESASALVRSTISSHV